MPCKFHLEFGDGNVCVGKRAAGNFLKSRGYLISKPTQIEKRYMRSPWAHLISRDPARFATIYSKNRELLASVETWATSEVLQSSLWRYGVPTEWDVSHKGALDRSGLPDAECRRLMGFDPAPLCAAPIPIQKRKLPIRPPSRRLPRPEGSN